MRKVGEGRVGYRWQLQSGGRDRRVIQDFLNFAIVDEIAFTVRSGDEPRDWAIGWQRVQLRVGERNRLGAVEPKFGCYRATGEGVLLAADNHIFLLISGHHERGERATIFETVEILLRNGAERAERL